MSGRTLWRAKPCGWRSRERVIALGEEFGPAGPQMLDQLEELAKEQRGDVGEVRSGLRSLARGAFLERGQAGVELAREILEYAAKIGAVDDLEISADADLTVTLRVSGFGQDQGRGYEAVRKAMQRAAYPESGDNVPECPPTRQDKKETALSSKPDVERVFEAWQESTGKKRAVLDPKRRRKIATALKAYPLDDLLVAVTGWQHSPHHRGENDRHTIFNDLELILRDAKHIEMFRDFAQSAPRQLSLAEMGQAINARVAARATA